MPGMNFFLNFPNDPTFKQKNRWYFKISGLTDVGGVNTLPPNKSARPSFSFKEAECQHLVETIYFPMKPEFKPINLTLFDLKVNSNPVITWLESLYNARDGLYQFIDMSTTVPPVNVQNNVNFNINNNNQVQQTPSTDFFFKKQAILEMYNGCGCLIEQWVYDNCYMSNIEWGELDHASGEIIMVNLTLRYDRAYTISLPDDNTQLGP